MAMLENIQEISSVIPGIVDLLIGEVNQGIETKEYRVQLLAGFMMCLWYDCVATL
jgi:hypothetical protein